MDKDKKWGQVTRKYDEKCWISRGFFHPYFLNFLFILVSARSTPSIALHAASNPRSTLHCGHAPHVLTRTSTGLFLKIRECGGPAVGFDPRLMHLSLERRTWAVALGQCNLKGKNVLLYTFKKKKKKLEVFKNNFNLVYIQVKVISVIIKK